MTVLAPALALSLLALSAQPQPVESVDSFEATLTKCLTTSAAPGGCFEAGMKGHFLPGNENLDGVVGQLRGLFEKWLGNDRVYAVHGVRRTTLGSWAERRIYIIEDTGGNVIMFDASFVRSVGRWYLKRFNLSSTNEALKQALGDVL